MIYTIRLQKYRSFTDSSFEFDPGVNIIVGPNASGKTNLLEALIVACCGKSFRARDAELLAHQQPWARLDVALEGHERTVKLEQPEQQITKKFVVDGQELHRLLPGKHLPYVLFEPNDLRLLHGGPEARREYIDSVIERLEPTYAKLRRDYRRTLAQRNALLKQNAGSDSIFVWDVRLSELGGHIAQQRNKTIGTINQQLATVYSDIAGQAVPVEMSYESSCALDNYSSSMLKRLKQNLERDKERGFSGAGPHRDEILFSLNQHPAKEVASRGETRTILLALKTIEAQLLSEQHNQKPILLLDDVFSELDGARRRHLTDFLSNYQAFITTTDADIVVQHFMNRCHIIPIEK